MNCLSDGTLRAYVDGELTAAESREIEAHFSECIECRTRSQTLSAAAVRVGGQLASLDGPPSLAEQNPQIALARFKSSLSEPEERIPLFARLFSKRWRFAWAFSAAGVVLLASLAFPSARGFAQKLLATLRVEKVQPIALDFSSMNDGRLNRNLQQALSQMISENVVVTTDEKPLPAASREQASALAGFPVRLLSARTDAPRFHLQGAHAFHMTIDRRRLQDVLDQAGRTDLILPATLDGATVSVRIPRAVGVAYGDCPEHRGDQGSNDAPPGPPAGADCVALVQAPSPTVNVPSDLNLQQLAETALQFTGMSAVQAREFCQTVDWKSTLILPVPPFIRSYETVEVDGVQGTLMRTSGRRGPSSFLIWVKNGVIYALINSSGDAGLALQLANSLD